MSAWSEENGKEEEQMPRRLISSEIFSHPVLMPLPSTATLLWIGLIVETDGDGRVCVDPKWLKRRLFGSRTRPALSQLERYVDLFESQNMLRTYLGLTQNAPSTNLSPRLKYAQITNFHSYQRLKKTTTNRE